MLKAKERKRSPAAALEEIDLRNDCLLSTKQAAALVGLTPKTLRQFRCDRCGPKFLKLGVGRTARCVYRRTDLEQWIRSKLASAAN
jgi:hypothetical protein